MTAPPKIWPVHNIHTAEKRLRRLRRRFGALSRRQMHPIRLGRIIHSVTIMLLTASAATLLAILLLRMSPFSPIDTLKHIAAFPNCDAAREVGLAPSNRGEPGYWAEHDRDNDGIACEPWTRR